MTDTTTTDPLADYRKAMAPMVEGRKATSAEYTALAARATGEALTLAAIVNTVATMQPANIVMDPQGALTMLRSVAAAALTHAQGAAKIAEQAANAYSMMADERQQLTDLCAELALLKLPAADTTDTPPAAPSGPVLAVDNGKGERRRTKKPH